MNDLEFAEASALPGGAAGSGQGTADAGSQPPPQGVAIGSLQGSCDALTGSGCADGQVCRFRREAGPACEPAPAAALEAYAACRRDDECAPGFLCEAGVCSQLCQSAADCGGAGARCLASAAGSFRRCSRSCDLVAARQPRAGLQACGQGARCDFVPEVGGAGYTDCFVARGTSFDGAPCAEHADCPPDFRCEGQRCAAACGANAACPGGLSCAGSLEELAGQRLGVCCSIPGGQACDLLTGCGCERGSTCSLDDAGAIACRALPAQPRAAYDSCEQHTDCPARSSCIGGACKLHCNVTADCGAEGTQCVPVALGEELLPGVSFCARGCDVLSPQAPAAGLRPCGAGTTCVDATPELGGTDCINAGAGLQGSPCALESDCAPGFDCFRGACERWCTPGGTECGLGLACSAVYDVGGRALGSCCTPPAASACSWSTDCGCGAGETCSIDEANATFCRAVSAAPSAAYGACGGDEQCPKFHFCVFGACMQRCEASADCSAGTQCLVFDEETPDTGICSRNCDMLSPSAPAAGFAACGPGLRCLDFDGPEGATTACILAGPVGAGGGCNGTVDCGLGLDCEDGLCLPLCELGASGCAPGTVCSPRSLATEPVGGRDIGVCRAAEE